MRSGHFRKLEQMYIGARINSSFYPSTRIRISEGSAEIQLEAGTQYHHAADGLHGSVYFKLLDDAAFFAVNSLIEDVFVLTTSFNLHFLRPVKVGPLTAVGKFKNRTGTVYYAESSLRNESNKEVAFGSGTFVKSKMPLSSVPGYSLDTDPTQKA